MMKRILGLVFLGVMIWSCDSTSSEKKEGEKVNDTQTISFENHMQKVSYAIGLDHGIAGNKVYAAEKLKGKFNISEIKNGLVDYLATNPLKIDPTKTDSILSLYLKEDGTVDSSLISVEIGSYTIGINEGVVMVSNFVRRGIDQEVDAALLVKGIEDGFNTKIGSYSIEEARADITLYYSEINQKNSQAFLDNNKSKDGVKITASGLQYQVFEEGKGARPNPADSVAVHYTGRYISGYEFDSSIPYGAPIRLSLMSVVKGWAEGLSLMQPGAKYRFFIPSDLAYGQEGRGEIESNTALVFDIELIEIIKHLPNY